MRLSARTRFLRFLGVFLVLALVSTACRSGAESATPATLLEAGSSTAESAPARTTATDTTGSTAETDHSALTVVVDSEPDSESGSSAPATSPTTGATSSSTTDSPTESDSGSAATVAPTMNPATSTSTAVQASDSPTRYATLGPGAALPTGAECAALVRGDGDETEHRPGNGGANATVPSASVTTGLTIDGADDTRTRQLASRIDGDFTGTTEQILRWGACKWGFDEDITRARAVAESSWRMSTTGDRTDDAALCNRIGLSAPCPQSYGRLQVKGTVHDGTYPTSARATAFGVDYAMAWLRACFEGGFGWLDGTGSGPGYGAGDEWGCVGAWFSGRWWDQAANDYVGKVRYHLEQRTWESYR